MDRTIFEAEHNLFRDGFRTFVAQEIQPCVHNWEAARICHRALFRTGLGL
jgi:hypothetical protein